MSDSSAASTCDQPMYGLYGATTLCARPAEHVGRHDPIWNHKDWPDAFPLIWEDCTGTFQVALGISRGDGIWPSMVNIDAEALAGGIAAHDARSLAAVLIRAAEACEASTEEVFGDA